MEEGSGRGADEGFIYSTELDSNQGPSSPFTPSRAGSFWNSPFSSAEAVHLLHTSLTSSHSQLPMMELFRAEGVIIPTRAAR